MTQAAHLDAFFKSLKRSGWRNNWLVAPADFVVKPDDVAPVFRVSVPALHGAFKAIALRSDGVEVVEESANAIHIIATTRLMRFKDDIWALFIPVMPYRSTLAIYSASRIGYWDMGTNRRRVKTWIAYLQNALNGEP
jgi:uncharacterized protein (DUF1499 family)